MSGWCANGRICWNFFPPPAYSLIRDGYQLLLCVKKLHTFPGSWSKLTNDVDIKLSAFGNARQRFVPVATKAWKKGKGKTIIMAVRDRGFRLKFQVAILPYNCVTWTRLFVCLKLDKLFSKLKRSFNSNSLEWMINCNLLHWSDLPGNHCENAGCVLLVACLCTLCISPIHDKTRQSLIRIFCNWAAMWKSQ